MRLSGKKLFFIFLFSLGFAIDEAAVVYYLRQLLHYGFNTPWPQFTTVLNLGFVAFVRSQVTIIPDFNIAAAEIYREISTLIVLISLAYLSGKTFRERLGNFLIAFSFWDIFYYAALWFLAGWPRNLLDKDVFFLLPIPSIGPVITALALSSAGLIIGLKLRSSQQQ
ncbi:hypothetical protein M1403_03680 [Patescibacteria group bacterium]|nr:hypothetical protein [Patescibacteria group bacterium]